MAQVDVNASAVTITITDPVELERVITVLHRSNSTKVAALRNQLLEKIKDQVISEVVTTEVVDDVLTGFEKLLEGDDK